jgi:hypothetical protein
MCAACRSILTPGARFCHRCGAAVGAAPVGAPPMAPVRGTGPVARGSYLPWTLVGLAVVALFVIMMAQRSSSILPPEATDDRGGAPLGSAAGGAAPDISTLSPRERESRLFDRIMRLASEGKRDSVAFFASMVPAVFESLAPLDLDLRYDYGRIGEVSGNVELAAAQADTILRQSPNHLLGLILAARVAELRGDESRRTALERQLLLVEASELRKSLDEYSAHRPEIDAAVAAARTRRR